VEAVVGAVGETDGWDFETGLRLGFGPLRAAGPRANKKQAYNSILEVICQEEN
jgi:hypothetical protein